MAEADDFVYLFGDLVTVEGKDGLWTVQSGGGVVGQPPNRYRIQFGLDGASIAYVTPDKMTLVKRPEPQDDGLGPRFIPARGIMD